MGKWATYRRRGGGHGSTGPAPPAPPTDANWQFHQVAVGSDATANGLGGLPAGYDRFGFQGGLDGGVISYKGRAVAHVEVTIAAFVFDEIVDAQCRFEDSANVLPPSDWSTQKQLDLA